METLKQKLFDVLAKAISLEDFENWLYNNKSIISSINDNDMLFDIVSMNYRSNHIYADLEKYCNTYFSSEEYLVSLVESSCGKLVMFGTSEEVWPVIKHISSFMNRDNNYGLINQFYYIEDYFYIVQDGFLKEKDILEYINKMAAIVLSKLEGLSMGQKIEVLKNGIDVNIGKTEFYESNSAELGGSNKKWYQFWK